MFAESDTAGIETITLHLPPLYRYLTVARDTALEVCTRLEFSEFDCYQVEMALDEACTNIIEHSYQGEPPPELALEHPGFVIHFIEREDRLVIEVSDRGEGFDYDAQAVQKPQQQLENQSERGLGMYIIQRFVDTVEYQRDPESGNRLQLTKLR